MSSTRESKLSFGTQSPPLEATPGGEEPLGVCSIRGDKPKAVPDREQRADYFKEDWCARSEGAGGRVEEGAEKRQQKIKTD